MRTNNPPDGGGGLLDRATATAWVQAMLQQGFDDMLLAEGFTRSAKAIGYARKVVAGKQRIDFFLTMHPNWAKDAVVLSLHTSLLMPDVAAMARTLLGETRGRGRPTALVDRQPLEGLVSRPRPMPFWARDDLDRYVPWITGYLRERVIPYLDARRTVEGFAENGGFWGGSPVYGAAAFLVLGQRDRAREFMEAAEPPDSPYRANYASAYAALADGTGPNPQ